MEVSIFPSLSSAPFADNVGARAAGFLYRLFVAESLKRVNPDNICELVAQQYAYDCQLPWACNRDYAIEFYRKNKPLLAKYLCDRYTSTVLNCLDDLKTLGLNKNTIPFPYDEAFVRTLTQNLVDGLNHPKLMEKCLYHLEDSTTRHHDVAFDVEVLESTVLGIWTTHDGLFPEDRYRYYNQTPRSHHRHGAGIIINTSEIVERVSNIIKKAIAESSYKNCRMNYKNIGHILSVLYRLYRPCDIYKVGRLSDMLKELCHYSSYHGAFAQTFSRKLSNHSLEIITWDILMKDTEKAVSLITSGQDEKPVTISVCYADSFQENYLIARYIYEQENKNQ